MDGEDLKLNKTANDNKSYSVKKVNIQNINHETDNASRSPPIVLKYPGHERRHLAFLTSFRARVRSVVVVSRLSCCKDSINCELRSVSPYIYSIK